jgi:hypothetical protein
MADPKTVEFRFGLTGLTIKEDPALLGSGAYRSMFNLEVVQEGTISTRAGTKLLGTGRLSNATAYKIAKLRVFAGESPSTPSLNPRYVGIQDSTGQNLYLTYDYNIFTKVADDINTLSGYPLFRFQLADYVAGGTGNIWAYIASELKMLKDRGNVSLVPAVYSAGVGLPRWGVLPAIGAVTDYAIAGPGNLDGGASGSPNGTTPYDYRYTYQSKDTASEGNPSQITLATLALHNQSAQLAVWTTDDPQIGFIKIYRRGGVLFDDWRLVGQVDNTGFVAGAPSVILFTDNVSDADLVTRQLLEVDNDLPVVSATPVPLIGTTVSAMLADVPATNFLPAGFTSVQPGTLVHILDPVNPEDVVIFQNSAPVGLAAIPQADHPSGTPIEVDAITGQQLQPPERRGRGGGPDQPAHSLHE